MPRSNFQFSVLSLQFSVLLAFAAPAFSQATFPSPTLTSISPLGGKPGATIDPAAVLKDVRNELLSSAKALADYGVAIDTTTWTVDRAATTRNREEIRRARGWTETPKVQRHDPPGLPAGAVRAAE